MDELSLLRTVLALAFVLGLIGLLAWLARRYEIDKKLLPGGRKTDRLGVEEMLMIDARHKLVLVKRDGVRHLVMVSATSMLLLESGIPPTEKV